MSYLTQKCTTCNGTARLHITTAITCTSDNECNGCIRCRECIEGRTAGFSTSSSTKNFRVSTRESTTDRESNLKKESTVNSHEEGNDSKRPSVVTTLKHAFKRSSTASKTPLSAVATLAENDSPVIVSASDAIHSANDSISDVPDKDLPSLPKKETINSQRSKKLSDTPISEHTIDTYTSDKNIASSPIISPKKNKKLSELESASNNNSGYFYTQNDNNLLTYNNVNINKGKGFKEWYTSFVNYTSHKNSAINTSNKLDLPITLETIYGTKETSDKIFSFQNSIKTSEIYDNLISSDKDGFGARYPIFVGRAEKDLLKSRIESRYRPLDVYEDDVPASCQISHDEEGARITSGNAEALIDALIFPLAQDMSYAEVFLSSFRFFMEPSALFNSLIEWYNTDVSSDNNVSSATPFLKKNKRLIQIRVIKVLLLWIKNHWHDFQTSGLLLNSVMAFAEYANEVSFGDGQRIDQTIREQRLAWYTLQYMPAFPPKRSNGGEKTGNELLFNFLAVESDDTLTIAKELSLIDLFYSKQIKPGAYLDVLARPVNNEYGGRNAGLRLLLEQQKWNRMLSLYISIVFVKEIPKNKPKILKRVIKIAQTLFELQSFNLVFVLINALESITISRVFTAWESLNVKYVEIFRKLQDFVNPAQGHSNYWSIIGQIDTPIIPYLAPYIHDLLEEYEKGCKKAPHLFKYAPIRLNNESDTSSIESIDPIKRSGPTKKRNYKTRQQDTEIAENSNLNPNSNNTQSSKENSTNSSEELSKEDKEYLQVSISDYVPTFEVDFEVFHSMYSVAAELEYWLRGTNDYSEYGPMKEFKTSKERLPELVTHIRDVCSTNSDAVLEKFIPYI